MLKTIIKTCKTQELTLQEWNSYVSNFNSVFEKEFNLEHFYHKYYSTCEGYSFHSFLIDENESVVGACTLIPMIYKFNEHSLKIALAVDLFILPGYRNDSLIFLKLYLNLKKMISSIEVVAVIAVPNVNSYLYWKNILKFKDVGNLPFWAYPVRIGNVIKRFSLLNHISLFISRISYCFNFVISQFYNPLEHSSFYEIEINQHFLEERFRREYETIHYNNILCYYKIVEEVGVKTAYLIYARENGKTSYKALLKGFKMIMKQNKVDLILFVGTLRIFQCIFIRVPMKLEPKKLPLICDILIKGDKEIQNSIYNIKNWDFGLINYDVR